MGRYFIEISYNGANYSGWQSQTNANSVQETLQTTARQVLRQPVEIVGSSRTDAGVHALHQVAQLDFEPAEPLDQLIFKLNRALPPDISVLGLQAVQPGTKARFDATSRSYRYVVCRRKDPFWHGRSLFYFGPLDREAMNLGVNIIRNTSNFQSFSKIHTEVNHFECKVLQAGWREEGHLLFFEITANRFLRGMVRALVGTLLDVGKGRISVADFEAIVEGKDRKKAGENAPAFGLYLTKVAFPSDIWL